MSRLQGPGVQVSGVGTLGTCHLARPGLLAWPSWPSRVPSRPCSRGGGACAGWVFSSPGCGCGWGRSRPSPGPRPTLTARTPGFPVPVPRARVSDNNRTTGNPGLGQGQPGQWPGFACTQGALGVPQRGRVGSMYHLRAIFSPISVSDPPIQKPRQPIPGHPRHPPGPTQLPGSTRTSRMHGRGSGHQG